MNATDLFIFIFIAFYKMDLAKFWAVRMTSLHTHHHDYAIFLRSFN